MMKRAAPAKTGLWTIDGDTLVHVEGPENGPAIVAVPSEQARAIVVDLPRAKRRAALPLAVEPHIAVPLGSVHVALGVEVAPRAFVAGVVDDAVMHRWTASIDAAGLSHAVVVPDALLLPIPPAGRWTVAAGAGRVRVRTDDGGGFAVADANFAAAWTQGGGLPCDVHGEATPSGLSPEMAHPTAAQPPSRAPLDLRQARHAAPRRTEAQLQRLGLIVTCGMLAHTAIAAADTIKLGTLVERQELERGPEAADRVVFLPLLARTAAVLRAHGDAHLTGLRFTGDRLTLRVAGPPEPISAALRDAGLSSVAVTGNAS